MSLLPSLLLIALAHVQSLVPSISSDLRTNTCLRRSAAIYTTGSSTYIITDLGSTSFPTGPTLCPNVSTVPASTVTVYQHLTATGPTVITDAGFENGQSSPFNTSASSPQVYAEVAHAGTGPLQPYSGNSYLQASPVSFRLHN
jgi:hypothetical protein